LTKKKEQALGIIALLVLIALVCAVVHYIWQGVVAVGNGVVAFVQKISTLDTVLIIALISASITIFGLVVNSVISIFLKTSEYKNKARTELRTKMEKPYAGFVSFIFDILMGIKSTNPMNEAEMTKSMTEFSKEVILYGSNKVVKKWSAYRTSAAKLPPIDNLKQLESVLYAIRKDLGFKKRRMKEGDILSLFINDIKDILKKKEA